MRFAFIRGHTALFEVSIVLRVLNVSKSGFHAWLERLTCPRAKQNAVLLEEIKGVHCASRGSYGSVRCMFRIKKRLRSTGLSESSRVRELPSGSSSQNRFSRVLGATFHAASNTRFFSNSSEPRPYI